MKFIDLFAGIGGFRLAFESLGCECVFASEWDKFSQQTYQDNFGDIPAGDIQKIESKDIPKHDILTAGFPCQPFSIAGVSKHNSLGNKHGFKHSTQGTLFFEIVRILKDKSPQAFLLENVKNLLSHDKGKTFSVIESTLREELGYHLYYQVIDASLLLPQHRKRIFLVGFKEPIKFNFPIINPININIEDILESDVEDKYTLTDHLWQYLQNYAQKHKEKGNGFGFGLVDLKGKSRTLSARYYKDGSEILIPQIGKNPRRLTPRECARLQGFPDEFKIIVSDTRAYKQFGNSVAVPIVKEIAKEMIKSLSNKIFLEIKPSTIKQLELPLVF
ncbi:DNA (cytosine-5-)-methyltransferase [Cyanobacterium sp. Dongsha4]|uniref:DNA (cytosine-5-)-methyltransferase n=1 Tax=Cyanobacterium sp. DS4 TaxID=2878255 RepID=UPI002E803311|nr:DNA (cytosine-5-)-methyltransferase [Cyanobacterium sp. Dongsha4]WVL01221.1 DNA (cytosine-5-)-methyltransferase [Cyanobacterium sp. Dongsha4]